VVILVPNFHTHTHSTAHACLITRISGPLAQLFSKCSKWTLNSCFKIFADVNPTFNAAP